MAEQEHAQPTQELHIVQERKRFLPLCCFGVTWVSRGWEDARDRHKLRKGEHPSTREYRKVRQDHPKAKKDWEWGVIVDETDTDPEGWQYGRCLWLPREGPTPSLSKTHQTNTREHMLDCVKQRRWVLLKDQEAVIEAGKRGSVSVLTPVELRQYRAEKQRRWEEGMGDVWKLLDELDKEADFRSQATALLDPVALQVVAAKHTEIMRAQKALALEQCAAVRLLEEPQWPITSIQGRVTHGLEDVLPKTEAAHDFAKSLGELFMGISRLPHHVSHWSHNVNISIQQQVLENKRRNNLRKMPPSHSHQELAQDQEPLWLQQLHQQRQQREAQRRQREIEQQQQQQQQQQQEQINPHNHNQPPSSGDEAHAAPKPRPLRPRQQQQQQPQVSPFREASLHLLPQSRVRIQSPDATSNAEYTPASGANALHTTGSDFTHSRKEASRETDDTTAFSGRSSPPQRLPDPEIPTSVSAPHPVFTHKRTPYGSTGDLETLGETVSGPNVVLEGGSARRGQQASADHGLQPSTRSQPLAYVEERETSTPMGVSVHSTATSPTVGITGRRAKPGGFARGLWRQGLMNARKALDLEGSGHHRHHYHRARRLEAYEHNYELDPFPKPMQLSLPELQCATGHALAIYGDLEEPGEHGICLQTYCGAIEKYTGVPESDVVMTVWRSQVFEPGHYVAIDRKAQKIVVSLRGTMETVDTLTDIVGRPVPVCFQGLRAHHKRHGAGVCHAGMLGAATSVFVSASAAVVEAHHREPKFDILVTGHSLGGGAASVLAIMLRGDSRLPRITRSRLRAVCLAPAASISGRMSRSCQHFMASIIYGSDIVPRVDLGSACNFVREVAAASPLRRLMAKVGKGFGMPWSKISDSAGTGAALGGTVAMDSAASTVTGKGYAGTHFVGAAARDAMRQHSAEKASRELKEGEVAQHEGGERELDKEEVNKEKSNREHSKKGSRELNKNVLGKGAQQEGGGGGATRSGHNKEEDSRELNEKGEVPQQGVEDSAGVGEGVRRANADRDQSPKSQQNGPTGGTPSAAAAGQQQDGKVAREHEQDEDGWLEGGQQNGAAACLENEAGKCETPKAKKCDTPKGKSVDRGHEYGGESAQSAGEEHGKEWSESGHPVRLGEVRIQLDEEGGGQGEQDHHEHHHHHHHHQQQHEPQAKQQSTQQKSAVNVSAHAGGARTGLAAVKEEVPGSHGLDKISSTARDDSHPQEGSKDDTMPRSGSKDRQQSGVHASQDMHRGFTPVGGTSRSKAVDNKVEGEEDEPLLRPMVPPGVVHWLLRAPVPQLTVASQRSSAVLLTPRGSFKSQASSRFPRASGNGIPSPSGQRPYSRAGTSGSNGGTAGLNGGIGEGANAPSPGRHEADSRAGTGSLNGGGANGEGASALSQSNQETDSRAGTGGAYGGTGKGEGAEQSAPNASKGVSADRGGGDGENEGANHAADGEDPGGASTIDNRNYGKAGGGTAVPAASSTPDTKARDQQHQHQQQQQLQHSPSSAPEQQQQEQQLQQSPSSAQGEEQQQQLQRSQSSGRKQHLQKQQLQLSPSSARHHQQEGQLGQHPSVPSSAWLSQPLEGHHSLPSNQLSVQLPGQHSLPASAPRHLHSPGSHLTPDTGSKRYKEHLQQQRQSSMLGIFSKLGSGLEINRSKRDSSGHVSKPTLFSKPSLFSKLSHNSAASKEGHEAEDHQHDEEQHSGDEELEVEESLGSKVVGAEDDDVSQLVLLRVEDKLISEGLFDRMLFFRQAITDHLPITYLKALRALLAQQRAEITAAHMANKRIAPPQGRLDALRRTVTQRKK